MVDILKQVGTTDGDRERYVRKHSIQLVCECSEDTPRDAIWAGNLEG
jgi:hypothetical protein